MIFHFDQQNTMTRCEAPGTCGRGFHYLTQKDARDACLDGDSTVSWWIAYYQRAEAASRVALASSSN